MFLRLFSLICIALPVGFLADSLQAQVSSQQLSDSEFKSLTATLNSLGDGYRSEIATAKIDYQTTYLNCEELKLTFEQTHERLDQLDFSKQDTLMVNSIRAFREDLFDKNNKKTGAPPRNLWDEKRLTVRGKDFISEGPYHDHMLQGDLYLLFDNGNQQVKCYEPGRCMIWTEDLNAFRMIPVQEMFEGVTLHRVGNLIEAHFHGTPESPESWVSLDPDDGLIRRQHLVNETGQPAKELIYDQFTTFPGGVLLPLVKVEISYREGLLKSIQFTAVKTAQFNMDVGDAEFVKSYPKGAGWFDFRNGNKIGGTFKQDVSDVCEFFRSRGAPVAIQNIHEGANSHLTSWIFLVNGLLLIVIGVYLWRRYP